MVAGRERFVSPPILWALGFAYPRLLYALAAASVPVIIHLLNRRKWREVPWAAMRFLLAAIRKNRRRLRIEQWLLLAIRTLVVLLVVSAMAKPFLESFGAVIAGRRTHRVIVLDASLSMAYTVGESSRFDEAKALAVQLVNGSRKGDAISVVLMGDPPRVVIGDPSPNLVEVKKEIDELQLTHGGTDLTATFEAVDRVLDVSQIGQKEVLFLTDLQAASWRPPAERLDGLKRALARLEARRPRSVVIDLGKPGGENRAVTQLSLAAPVATVGDTVLIRATVRNFGNNRSDGVRVRLTADGRLGPQESLDLAPGRGRPHRLPPPVHHAGRPSDRGVARRRSSGSRQPPLAGRAGPRVARGPPGRRAFQVRAVPGRDRLSGPGALALRGIAGAVATDPRRSRLRVAGLASRSGPLRRRGLVQRRRSSLQAEVAALDDYLKQGGGVVIFGGDQVLADNYNRLLYDDGKGLLPVAFGPSVGDAAKKDAGFYFNPLGYRHPIVSEYQGEAAPVTVGADSGHHVAIPQARAAAGFEGRGRARV